MNLNQVTIPVLDVERAIVFYQKLGLQLIVKALPRYARFVCPVGNATFSLHQVEKMPTENGVWVYFECEDVDSYVEELLAKGIGFEELPTDKKWFWREARLNDLDGNVIILYHAGNNRMNPPWRI